MNFLVHEEWVGDTSILSENTEVRHFTLRNSLWHNAQKQDSLSTRSPRCGLRRARRMRGNNRGPTLAAETPNAPATPAGRDRPPTGLRFLAA